MTNFYLVTFLFFVQVFSLNWQSHGNFSSQQLTQIESSVTTYSTLITGASKTNSQAALQISNNLNTKFDNAWNVFVIKIYKNLPVSDGVVSGYAFRQHWFWYNDYTSGLIFIIWKDYNCNPANLYVWNSNQRNSFQQSGINTSMVTYLNGLLNANPTYIYNPWLVAEYSLNKANQLVPNSAWTALAIGTYISNWDSNYAARFCSLGKENYIFQQSKSINSQFYILQIHLLRMR